MKPGLFGVLVVATVGVWVLAFIGLVNVVGAITTEPVAPAQPSHLLDQRVKRAGVEVGGLDRYPGAVRTDYRSERLGNVMVSEVEYQSEAAIELVGAHYSAEFERSGWLMATAERRHGEWAYTVTSDRGQLVVEIERRGGITEIEIDLIVPVASRGQTTGR